MNTTGPPAADTLADSAAATRSDVSAGRWHARLGLLVFLSGLCALVYQVVWLRELRLMFGASTPASAAVLAIFMGGLGLGGWLLGRRAQEAPNPLALYAALEAGIAVGAGVTPWTIGWVAAAYHGFGGSAALGTTGAALVRLLLATVVLGIPTFLMGGTLPAIVRAATGAADRGRRSLGVLYGVNTMGAVVGVTLATFVLLEALGQRRSLWVAALVNLLVAVTARAWSRRLQATAEVTITDPLQVEPAPPPEEPEPAATPRVAPSVVAGSAALAPVPLVLALAAAVGFVFFLMEIAWYRLLTPILGGSTYTFGAILLTALAGIGAGGLLYGAGSTAVRPTLARFATTCGIEALLLVVPLALGHRLAMFTQALRGLEALGFAGLVAGWLLVVAVVVLPVSVVAGYQFPLLVGLLGAGGRDVSIHTGRAYAANTFGAIAGSLAGGFGLLPLLSAPGVWRLATVLLAMLALASAARFAWPRGGWRGSLVAPAPGVVAALFALALCLLPGPGTLWRHGQIGAGRGPRELRSAEELRAKVALDHAGLLWEADGRESAVGVRADNGLTFFVNGKSDGNARLDGPTQVMSPLVPALLHPAPRRGLVIGLGTGSSAGWLAAVPGMERVDVVELEPVIARYAAECAAVNHDAMADPRVHLVIGDGRELLLTSDERWDVVFSEPSNPYRAGIASLFTRELYAAAAKRLAPGGIFAQWLQAYEVDAEVVATVYGTLGDVFPYVETWAVHRGDLLLVASLEPLRHDSARLAARLGAEPYRSALPAVWGVDGLEGFYSGYVASPAFARRVRAADPPRNLDDRPVIEFGFARSLGRSVFGIADLRRSVAAAERRPPGVELDWERVDDLRDARQVFLEATPAGPAPPPGEAAARRQARVAAAKGDLAAAARWWTSQPQSPRSLVDALLLGEGLAEAGDPRAADIAAGLQADNAVEAAALLARWHLRSGRREVAANHLARALEGLRDDPWPWPAFAARMLDMVPELGRDPALARRLLAPMSQPFAAHVLELPRSTTLVPLAMAAGGDACVAAYRRFEPHPLWTESFLRGRRDCYRRTDDPLAGAASRDLGRFLAARPRPLSALLDVSTP